MRAWRVADQIRHRSQRHTEGSKNHPILHFPPNSDGSPSPRAEDELNSAKVMTTPRLERERMMGLPPRGESDHGGKSDVIRMGTFALHVGTDGSLVLSSLCAMA